MPIPDYLAVVDLETTGSDEYQDQILEFGMILAHTKTLEPIDEYSAVIGLTPAGDRRFRDNDIVLAMHETTGLYKESVSSILRVSQVDHTVSEWLREYNVEPQNILLTGSGVGHFDMRFLRAQMPQFCSFLPYAPFDIGSERRGYGVYGLPELVAPVLESYRDGVKKHRALADAQAHLEELRAYKKMLHFLVGVFHEEHGTDVSVWDYVNLDS